MQLPAGTEQYRVGVWQRSLGDWLGLAREGVAASAGSMCMGLRVESIEDPRVKGSAQKDRHPFL